jgi:plastocyanin
VVDAASSFLLMDVVARISGHGIRRMHRIPLRIVGVIAVGVILAGCSGDSGESLPPGTDAPTTASVPVRMSDHVVVTQGLSFSPSTLTITAGETVEFQIGAGHNLVWDCAGDPLTGTITRTFDEVGSFGYCCGIHGGMSGVIIVE